MNRVEQISVCSTPHMTFDPTPLTTRRRIPTRVQRRDHGEGVEFSLMQRARRMALPVMFVSAAIVVCAFNGGVLGTGMLGTEADAAKTQPDPTVPVPLDPTPLSPPGYLPPPATGISRDCSRFSGGPRRASSTGATPASGFS